MKIESQPRDDQQVKLTAEFEPEEFERYKHQAARKLSQESKIPGFRPGKAPYNIVLRTFGEDTIQKEAIDLLIDDQYPKVLEQAGVKPSGPGSLENIASMEPLKLDFIVPLQPEIILGDYRSIRLPYEPAPLSEEEVDRFFDRLRNTYATIEPADRPAQEGDLVSVTVSGRLTHPAEGEDAEVIKDSPAQALVRQPEEQPGSEWPFPGFGMQLIGLSASDEKKTTFTYAEDADYETLRGKEVEFTAKVDSVKKYTLPELNDEFAQTVGEYASLEEMRKSIRARLEENAREDYDKDYFNQLMDKIGEQAVVKYPPQILDDEIEEVLHSVEHNLSHQNLDVETYLKMRQLERDKFIEDEIKPVAKSRLQRSLIMDEVARHEKIEVKDDEVQQEFQQTLAELQNSGELKESQRKVGPERLANAIAVEAFSRLMNRRVLEQLKSIATGQAEAAAQAQATPAEKATETVEGDPASEPKAKPARKRAKKATETTTKEE